MMPIATRLSAPTMLVLDFRNDVRRFAGRPALRFSAGEPLPEAR